MQRPVGKVRTTVRAYSGPPSEGGEGRSCVDDNFSETSWENYRNNFFTTMIPREKEYSTFGLPTVVESPRFGPKIMANETRGRSRSMNSEEQPAPAKSRRSSSYSQVVIDGPQKKEENAPPEIAVLVIPISAQEQEARSRARSQSHVSIRDTVDIIPSEMSIVDESSDDEKVSFREKKYVTTTAYTIGKFELFDGEGGELAPGEPTASPKPKPKPEESLEVLGKRLLEESLRNVPVERVVFPEEGEVEPKKQVKEEAKEPVKEEKPVSKYVPRSIAHPVPAAKSATQQNDGKAEITDPPHVHRIGSIPPITSIHYSDSPVVNPVENSFGETRIMEFDFVVNDTVQYIEGKMFYFPRQVVKLQCAPYVHVHDTDFMKEG